MGRRPDGALEQRVLRVLWSSAGPLTPAEVRDGLDLDLAYTTVATVLGRLCAKGLAVRHVDGRAHRYSAAVAEADHAARSIDDVLRSAADRSSVLAGFVGSLSARDIELLKSMLKDLP